MTFKNVTTPKPKIKQIVEGINKNQNIVKENNNDDTNNRIKFLSDKEQAVLKRFKNDTQLKRSLTLFVVIFTSIWSALIWLFVFLFGFQIVNVSDAIIITLLTETIGIIIGLPLVVTSHFFPKQK